MTNPIPHLKDPDEFFPNPTPMPGIERLLEEIGNPSLPEEMLKRERMAWNAGIMHMIVGAEDPE